MAKIKKQAPLTCTITQNGKVLHKVTCDAWLAVGLENKPKDQAGLHRIVVGTGEDIFNILWKAPDWTFETAKDHGMEKHLVIAQMERTAQSIDAMQAALGFKETEDKKTKKSKSR